MICKKCALKRKKAGLDGIDIDKIKDKVLNMYINFLDKSANYINSNISLTEDEKDVIYDLQNYHEGFQNDEEGAIKALFKLLDNIEKRLNKNKI